MAWKAPSRGSSALRTRGTGWRTWTSKSRSSEVKGKAAREGRGGGFAAGDGGSAEDGDGTATTTTTTTIKVGGVGALLPSSVLVAAAGPVGQGGAAEHGGADGQNKSTGRPSPAPAEANT